MNKAELIDKIAEDAGVNKKQAAAALDSFTDTIAKTLKKGDKVTLVGFGPPFPEGCPYGAYSQTWLPSRSKRRK